jgi:hypothetical protein
MTTEKVKVANTQNQGKIQDEARSYRSKVGAMRLFLKNESTRQTFKKFIEEQCNEDPTVKRVEFISYFEFLEQMKPLPQHEQISRLKTLLSMTPIQQNEDITLTKRTENRINSTIWSCLRPLRPLKLDSTTLPELVKAINATQDLLLSPVCPEFERFMDSDEFEECKKTNLENHKTGTVPTTADGVKPIVVGTAKPSTTTTILQPKGSDLGFTEIGV